MGEEEDLQGSTTTAEEEEEGAMRHRCARGRSRGRRRRLTRGLVGGWAVFRLFLLRLSDLFRGGGRGDRCESLFGSRGLGFAVR